MSQITKAQKTILNKMNLVHTVRIEKQELDGTLSVFSHIKKKKSFLCYTVKKTGSVNLEYISKMSPKLKKKFQEMRVLF